MMSSGYRVQISYREVANISPWSLSVTLKPPGEPHSLAREWKPPAQPKSLVLCCPPFIRTTRA